MIQDWERVRGRYEAWWEGELIDGPLVRVTAPLGSATPAAAPRDTAGLSAWLTDPEQVLPRLEARIAATYYAGDAFAWADPLSQSLAAIQAAYHGGKYSVDAETLTGWAEPVLEDWASRPALAPDTSNFWWQATLRLLEAGARQGGKRWCAAIPDLQGGGEILALLRGSERLAMDLLDHADEIGPAIHEINTSWLFYFKECYAAIHRWQAGYVDWLGIWSERPAATVECDYMVMVSTRMFERFFLPGVSEQVGMVERSIFHLDGPGAVKHLDMLLSLPRLGGIQWVPTPERPHPADWIGMFKKILAAGKRLVLTCAPGELNLLLDELQPDLLLVDVNCACAADADEIIRSVERRTSNRWRAFLS
jgi:hypothetical protein